MAKKRKSVKTEYVSQVKKILVVNDKKLKPYLETVFIEPTNITQKKLGKLLGIFEIKSADPAAAYIVNFLVSVAKKEYFLNPKRTPEKSFEATLHKLNLAFSELAKHDNLSWLGNTNIAIAALVKNNFFFGSVGSAKILLFRDDHLSEITYSEGDAQNPPQPLKTFSEISSGKLKTGDKLIFTTTDTFQIIPFKELEKKARLLSPKKFKRFLNTALVNELMGSATLIIDIQTKEIAKPKLKSSTRKTKINAFSEKTFRELQKPKKIDKIPDKKTKRKKDFIDKKTGHIYIREEVQEKPSEIDSSVVKKKHFLEVLKSKIKKTKKVNLSSHTKNIKNIFSHLKKKVFSSFSNLHFFTKNLSNQEEEISPPAPPKEKSVKKDMLQSKPSEKIKRKKNNQESQFSQFFQKTFLFFKSKRFFHPLTLKKSIVSQVKIPSFFKYNQKTVKKIKQSVSSARSWKSWKIWPDFGRLKRIFLHLTLAQKLTVFFILILIVGLPLIFRQPASFDHRSGEEKVAGEFTHRDKTSDSISKENEASVKPVSEKEVFSQAPPETFYIISHQDSLFLVTPQKIILINQEDSAKKEEIVFPLENKEKIQQAVFMDDLNLLFLLTDHNKLFSFSPLSLKINRPKIDIPDNAEITAMGTYLTYLYLTDKKAHQIFRYPRAEGGFGKKVNWLKEDLDLDNIVSLSINGDIYLIYKNHQIKKLSHGKLQNFNLQLDKDASLQNFWAMEDHFYGWKKSTGEIIRFNQQGIPSDSYQSPHLKKAVFIYLSDDEQNYLLTNENRIINFSFSN